jgi:hypothetical protein
MIISCELVSGGRLEIGNEDRKKSERKEGERSRVTVNE